MYQRPEIEAAVRKASLTQNPKKPLLDVLSGQKRQAPPIWMMRQAGRYLPEYREVRARAGGFLDLCFNPDFAAEVTLQPIRRFGFDAAIIFSDILVIPYALGRACASKRAKARGSIRSIRRRRSQRWRRRPISASSNRSMKRCAACAPSSPQTSTLIGFCGAPWTVATYMVAGQGTPDQAPARMLAYRDPEAFSKIIDALVENSIEYLLGQLKAGADCVQIFDTWAGVLPPREFLALVDRADRAHRRRRARESAGREDHRLSPRRRRAAAGLYRRNRRECRQHRLGGRAVIDPRACAEPRSPCRAISIRSR